MPTARVGDTVAEESKVADAPDLGKCHRMLGVLGESTRMHESWGIAVTDKERRDYEVDFVHQSAAEKLGMNGAAPLHHQALDLAPAEVIQHDAQVNWLAGGHHSGGIPENIAKSRS